MPQQGIFKHRTKSEEDQFVKALYYAFGCSDNGHSCDPHAYATWHAVMSFGTPVQDTFKSWQGFTQDQRDSLRRTCMRMAFVNPGCKIEVPF